MWNADMPAYITLLSNAFVPALKNRPPCASDIGYRGVTGGGA
jgi:hypothetical protein